MVERKSAPMLLPEKFLAALGSGNDGIEHYSIPDLENHPAEDIADRLDGLGIDPQPLIEWATALVRGRENYPANKLLTLLDDIVDQDTDVRDVDCWSAKEIENAPAEKVVDELKARGIDPQPVVDTAKVQVTIAVGDALPNLIVDAVDLGNRLYTVDRGESIDTIPHEWVSVSPTEPRSCKWFDPIKGYGFIHTSDGSRDTHMLARQLVQAAFQALGERQVSPARETIDDDTLAEGVCGSSTELKVLEELSLDALRADLADLMELSWHRVADSRRADLQGAYLVTKFGCSTPVLIGAKERKRPSE